MRRLILRAALIAALYAATRQSAVYLDHERMAECATDSECAEFGGDGGPEPAAEVSI